MKTRILSAAAGLAVLAVVIAFYDTLVLDLFIAALAMIGIYEAHHAAGITREHWRITLYCELFAVLFLLVPKGREYALYAVYVLAVLVFAYILEHHKTFTIREGAYALLMGAALPAVFGLIVQLRESFGNEQGILYLVFLLGSAQNALHRMDILFQARKIQLPAQAGAGQAFDLIPFLWY